jgi:hypothetical protein
MYGLILIVGALQAGASIQGTVRTQSTLEPISGASVSLPELRRTVVTDSLGGFVLADVPAGRWRIDARAFGYASHALTVVSAGSGTYHLDFELAVRPFRLGGVSVVAPGTASGINATALDPAGPPPMRMAGAGELKYVPGVAEPDLLRALHVLPAVATISDFSNALYIRGGASDQNVVLLDGVPILNPYHLGGLFSAVNPDAVNAVDVWTGSLPASSPADRLAAAVQIQPRSGSRERMQMRGTIGLISSQLTLDGPLPGGKGGYLVSGRNTYLDLIADAAYATGLLPGTVPYGFSDVLARVDRELGPLGSISWSAYLNREAIAAPGRSAPEPDGELDFDWGSRMSVLTVRRPLGNTWLAQLRFGYTDFFGGFVGWEHTSQVRSCPDCPDQPLETVTVDGTSLTRRLSAELDLVWYARAHQLRLGGGWADWKVHHDVELDGVEEDALISELDGRERTRTYTAYFEDEWNVAPRLHLRAGVRLLDAGAIGRAWLPRLGARITLDDAWALSAGAGRYAQALRGMRDDESVISSFIAYELLSLQPQQAGLAEADDVVLGVQFTRPRLSARIDAYARRMRNLVLGPRVGDPLDTPALITDEYRIGQGTSQGVEAMARWQLTAVDLGFNYALAHTQRRVGSVTYTPRFERQHRLDLTSVYRASTRTLLSARLTLASGQPYTPALTARPNSARMPGYARLDVAARRSSRKRWFGRETAITPYVQILNVLNSKNVMIATPATDPSGKPLFDSWPQFPILPTFGVEWTF